MPKRHRGVGEAVLVGVGGDVVVVGGAVASDSPCQQGDKTFSIIFGSYYFVGQPTKTYARLTYQHSVNWYRGANAHLHTYNSFTFLLYLLHLPSALPANLAPLAPPAAHIHMQMLMAAQAHIHMHHLHLSLSPFSCISYISCTSHAHAQG